MADNFTADPGSGGDTFAADDISSVKYPRTKITIGSDGTNDGDVSSANPLPITHAALTELAAAIDTEVQCDVVGALPAGTNAIGKLAANSGVDIGDVDVTSLPTTVHSADYDTGAGTDTTLAFGIAVPASGGAAVIPGDATAGLKVDLGADNDVTVTGSVTCNAGTNLDTSALATSAKQDTIIGHVDGLEGLLTTIDGDTGSLAGCVGGTEIQVDIVGALPAGTNAIGKLAANSGVDIGDVDVTSISAGTNTIGGVISMPSTSTMYTGTTALTPAFATIDTASSGDVTVVDPGAGKKVRVLSLFVLGTGTAVSVYYKTGSTAKFGSSSRLIVLDKTGATGPAGACLPFNPMGWFEGAADENLVINLSTTQGVWGNVTYVEI